MGIGVRCNYLFICDLFMTRCALTGGASANNNRVMTMYVSALRSYEVTGVFISAQARQRARHSRPQ
jgi:hypothetical protein